MAESLKVVLSADDAQFQEAIKRAIGSVDGLAGRTLAFGTAANTATGTLDKLKGPLRELATSSLRVQGGFGAVAEQLLTAFGVGGTVIAGVGAGVLALTFAYNKLTAETRKLKEENDALVESLLKAANLRANPLLNEQRGLSAAAQTFADASNRTDAAQRVVDVKRGAGISDIALAQDLRILQEAITAERNAKQAYDEAQRQLATRLQSNLPASTAPASSPLRRGSGRGAAAVAPDLFQTNLADLLAQTGDGSNLEDNAATIDGFFDTQVEALAEEGASAAETLGASLRTSFGESIAFSLVDGIGNGFAALFSSGSLGKGFAELTRSLLGGLGQAMVAFGKQSLLAATLMQKIKGALSSFLPGGAIVASIALIAAGSLISNLAGAAQSSFGGNGGTSGFSGSSASVASAVQDRGSVTIVWPRSAFANPNDPAFQDLFAETVRALGGTRQLVIQEA
jgi:hypothetical protein